MHYKIFDGVHYNSLLPFTIKKQIHSQVKPSFKPEGTCISKLLFKNHEMHSHINKGYEIRKHSTNQNKTT